jgi:hypothetical protein
MHSNQSPQQNKPTADLNLNHMLSKLAIGFIGYIALMTMSHAQAVTVTGNIPYAADLKKQDGYLKVWTISKIREDKHHTVNPIEGSVMIKDNNSLGDKLGDSSETPDETKEYGGTLDLTSAVLPATIAILVDDIATLTIKEIPTGSEPAGHIPFTDTYKVEGTALWNPKSYKEFSNPLSPGRTLPPGRKYKLDLVYKNTANLTAKYTDGKVDIDGVSVYVSLLPMEVEQQNDTLENGIQFCRWLDSFTDDSFNQDCADKDRDRFRIRFPVIIPNLTKIKIKSTGLNIAISGQDAPKTTDGDYEVELKQENGAMVSTWILLVGDDEDDVKYNGKGKDDKTNDQTLLADFDSPIEVTLPEYTNTKAVFRAQKALGKLQIQPYYLSPAGDVTEQMEGFIKAHLNNMKEIYRQIGIQVDYSEIVGHAVPQEWFDARPDAVPKEDAKLLTHAESSLARNVVSSLEVPGKQIRIGFVDAKLMRNTDAIFGVPVGARGFTFTNTDGIIVSLDVDARFFFGVTAHEVGHTLGLDHASTNWQRWLMRGRKEGDKETYPIIWSNSNPVENSKRFQSGDFDIISKSKTFYVPN